MLKTGVCVFVGCCRVGDDDKPTGHLLSVHLDMCFPHMSGSHVGFGGVRRNFFSSVKKQMLRLLCLKTVTCVDVTIFKLDFVGNDGAHDTYCGYHGEYIVEIFG